MRRSIAHMALGGFIGVASCGVLVWISAPDAPSKRLATATGVQIETPARNDETRLRPRATDSTRGWRVAAEERLAAIEAQLGQPLTDNSRGASAGESEAPAAKPSKATFTQADLGDWMADTLRSAEWDPQATKTAELQVNAALAALPDVRVNEVECGRRFCRAAFFREDGQPPTLGTLLGAPPFTSEGFTLNEPDGRIAMYFTQSGESLEKLREEASSHLAPD